MFFHDIKKIDFNPVHSVYLIWIFVVVVVVDFVVVVLAVVDGIVVVVLSVVDGIVVKLSVVDGLVLFSITSENFKNWFVILLYLYHIEVDFEIQNFYSWLLLLLTGSSSSYS